MKYRKLDANGDYMFGFNRNEFYTDANAVSQAIQTKLSLFEGEWWENVDDGLPLFQQILNNSNIANIDLIVQNRIMETPNVNSIVSYQSNYNDKTYSASTVVNTTYGNITVGVNS